VTIANRLADPTFESAGYPGRVADPAFQSAGYPGRVADPAFQPAGYVGRLAHARATSAGEQSPPLIAREAARNRRGVRQYTFYGDERPHSHHG
jgi:hypothetical protein